VFEMMPLAKGSQVTVQPVGLLVEFGSDVCTATEPSVVAVIDPPPPRTFPVLQVAVTVIAVPPTGMMVVELV